MIKPFKSALISILILFCTAAILKAESTPGLNVSYNQKEDLLTVDAKGVPLTRILAQIAEQSGIEIMIDPSVEKEINLYLPSQPLEKALKQLARDLNFAMHYDKSDSRLIAMKIVPQGKQSLGSLVSLNGLDNRPQVDNELRSNRSSTNDSYISDSNYSVGGNYGLEYSPEITDQPIHSSKNRQKKPIIRHFDPNNAFSFPLPVPDSVQISDEEPPIDKDNGSSVSSGSAGSSSGMSLGSEEN